MTMKRPTGFTSGPSDGQQIEKPLFPVPFKKLLVHANALMFAKRLDILKARNNVCIMEDDKQEPFSSISYEEYLAKAKWFKEDLEKGDGWSKAAQGPWYTYWFKTILEDEMQVKMVYELHMPFSVKAYAQLLDPQNLEYRRKWDKQFINHECLEAFPNDKGYVVYMQTPLSWPLTNRSFVFYTAPPKEVDWFGKPATLFLIKNAHHAAKPEGEDGLVRATNGGNFYVATPDEEKPNDACRVFGLSSNHYNGWIPNTNIEWLMKMVVPPKFIKYTENMIEGYETYFKE